MDVARKQMEEASNVYVDETEGAGGIAVTGMEEEMRRMEEVGENYAQEQEYENVVEVYEEPNRPRSNVTVVFFVTIVSIVGSVLGGIFLANAEDIRDGGQGIFVTVIIGSPLSTIWGSFIVYAYWIEVRTRVWTALTLGVFLPLLVIASLAWAYADGADTFSPDSYGGWEPFMAILFFLGGTPIVTGLWLFFLYLSIRPAERLPKHLGRIMISSSCLLIIFPVGVIVPMIVVLDDAINGGAVAFLAFVVFLLGLCVCWIPIHSNFMSLRVTSETEKWLGSSMIGQREVSFTPKEEEEIGTVGDDDDDEIDDYWNGIFRRERLKRLARTRAGAASITVCVATTAAITTFLVLFFKAWPSDDMQLRGDWTTPIDDIDGSDRVMLGVSACVGTFFVLAGLPFAASRKHLDEKFCLASIFGIILPLGILLAVWDATQSNTALMMAIAIPAGTVGWFILAVLKYREQIYNNNRQAGDSSRPFNFHLSAVWCCLLLFTPVGTIPVLLFVGDYSDVSKSIMAALILIPVLSFVAYIIYRIIVWVVSYVKEGGLKDRDISPDSILAALPAVKINTWLSSSGTLFSMVILILVFFLLPHRTGGKGIIIALMVGVPAFYVLGTLGTMLRGGPKYWFAFLVFLCLPLLICFLVVSTTEVSSEVEGALVTVGIGAPFSVLAWSVIWMMRDKFKIGEDVVAISQSICCLFIFIPFGVIIPIVAAAEFTDEFDSNQAVGTAAILVMTGVSVSSIVLNARLRKMELEKKAKLAVHALRKALIQHSVVIDPNIGRLIFDDFHFEGRDHIDKLLRDETFLSWTDQAGMEGLLKEVVLVEDPHQEVLLLDEREEEELEEKGEKNSSFFSQCTCCMPRSMAEAIQEEVPVQQVIPPKDRWERAMKRLRKTQKGRWILKKLEYTPELMDKFTARVFEYYATSKADAVPVRSMGDNERAEREQQRLDLVSGDKSMSLFNFRQVMRDSKLVGDGDFTLADSDRIFVKATQGEGRITQAKVPLTFDLFFTLIGEVGMRKFNIPSREEGFDRVMKQYVIPNCHRVAPGDESARSHLNSIQRTESQKSFGGGSGRLRKQKSRGSALTQFSDLIKQQSFKYDLTRVEHSFSDASQMTGGLGDSIEDLDEEGSNETWWQRKKKSIISLFTTPAPKEEDLHAELTDTLDATIVQRSGGGGVSQWKMTWAEAVEVMLDALEKYNEMDGQEDIEVNLKSFSNLFAIFNLLVETVSLMSIAFSEGVEWDLTESEQNTASVISFELPNVTDSFYTFYWLSFTVAFIFPFYASKGIRDLRRSEIGSTEIARFSGDFFYLKGLTVFGATMYFPVLKSLVSALACTDNGEQTVLTLETSMVCWEGGHFAYVATGLVGVVMYYPVATFMFPNMQFQTKALDVKFRVSFLVLLAQGKLFLAGLSIFFRTTDGTDNRVLLGWSTVVFLALFAINTYMEPCIVKRVNVIRGAGFIACAWACFCGMLADEGVDVYIRWVLLLTGWALCVVLPGLYVRKRFRVVTTTADHKLSLASAARQDEGGEGDDERKMIAEAVEAEAEASATADREDSGSFILKPAPPRKLQTKVQPELEIQLPAYAGSSPRSQQPQQLPQQVQASPGRPSPQPRQMSVGKKLDDGHWG